MKYVSNMKDFNRSFGALVHFLKKEFRFYVSIGVKPKTSSLNDSILHTLHYKRTNIKEKIKK